MRNAFGQEKKKTSFWRILLPTVCFVVIVLLVILGVRNVSSAARGEQLNAMEQAVRRAVVQCYAIEGQYPDDLEYLQENYGLILDQEKYVYHYKLIGGNLMPELFVFAVQ